MDFVQVAVAAESPVDWLSSCYLQHKLHGSLITSITNKGFEFTEKIRPVAPARSMTKSTISVPFGFLSR